MHTKDELASENDASKQKGDYKDIIHRRQKLDKEKNFLGQ